MTTDADAARDLLERAHLREMSGHLLAAAQVHATLAVEQSVRDLIAVVKRGMDETERWPSGTPGVYVYDPEPH